MLPSNYMASLGVARLTSDVITTNKDVRESQSSRDVLKIDLQLPLPILVPDEFQEVGLNVGVVDCQEMLGPLTGNTSHESVHHNCCGSDLPFNISSIRVAIIGHMNTDLK